MNWKTATLAQLYEIAFNDQEARIDHKQAAAAEIKRRQKKSFARKNYKEVRA